MDKSLFEKYINEMKEMKKKSAFPNESVVPVLAEREEATELEIEEESENTEKLPDADQMEGVGYLLVNVTSVNELYPVSNAKITIFTGDSDNRKIFAEGTTDISGKAGPFELKAPNIEYSETPNSSFLPFAYYNILTEAVGFVDTIHLGVQIFDKVTSIQKVNLFSAMANKDNSTVIINEINKEEI